MPIINDPVVPTNLARVEVGGALRVTQGVIGDNYSQGNMSGVLVAALAANSCVYGMRSNPGTTKKIRINRIRLQWTTIVAFTTPVTAGRRLSLFRGVGAGFTGGTEIGAVASPTSELDSLSPPSQCDSAQGGSQRIATTAALGVAGITFEPSPLAIMSLSHLGTAGAFVEQIFDFNDDVTGPLILNPGELIAVRNPIAMDAAGTWQLAVNVRWTEIDNLA
jgi:hypothetical protein